MSRRAAGRMSRHLHPEPAAVAGELRPGRTWPSPVSWRQRPFQGGHALQRKRARCPDTADSCSTSKPGVRRAQRSRSLCVGGGGGGVGSCPRGAGTFALSNWCHSKHFCFELPRMKRCHWKKKINKKNQINISKYILVFSFTQIKNTN